MPRLETFFQRSSHQAFNIKKHPCFDYDAVRVAGRIHLPLAPRCNIQCKFCSKKYSCISEDRPGVTRIILHPSCITKTIEQALVIYPELSVIGIAGPGDALANPNELFVGLEIINQKFPGLSLCICTNGLLLPKYANDLLRHRVEFISVTVNAIDPSIGKDIYSWIYYRGKLFTGLEGVRMLINSQIEGLRLAIKLGMQVKVNTVLIPGVNDQHLEDIARAISRIGVQIMNIIPLIPIKGTELGKVTAPDQIQLESAWSACEKFIKVMRHCNRCRADAMGLLHPANFIDQC